MASLIVAALAATNGRAVPDLRGGFEQHRTEQSKQAELNKLVDFNHYQKVFNKRYGSLIEQTDRRRRFLASAFRAVITRTKYMLCKLRYYESLNFMSDYTSQELNRMRNKVLNDELRASSEHQAARKQIRESNGEREPPKLMLARACDFEPDIETGTQCKLRELPPLINPGAEQSEPVAEQSRPGADLSARTRGRKKASKSRSRVGFEYQKQPVVWWEVAREDETPRREEASCFRNPFSKFAKKLLGRSKEIKRNEMFFDHRDSNCLTEPRWQGLCGACYAFAGVTVMEWLHCMKTGQLVEFSEQYLIDCGKLFYNKMRGCEGGEVLPMAEFIQNFGLQLRSEYLYRGQNQKCPYDWHVDLKKTGKARIKLNDATVVNRSLWAKAIQYQPLLVELSVFVDSFERYGGGVHTRPPCVPNPDHLVLLVGHGRQDGLEFWLIRNSFGSGWGERGYYKLAKGDALRCLSPKAYALGTPDGYEQTAVIMRPMNGEAVEPTSELYRKALWKN